MQTTFEKGWFQRTLKTRSGTGRKDQRSEIHAAVIGMIPDPNHKAKGILAEERIPALFGWDIDCLN